MGRGGGRRYRIQLHYAFEANKESSDATFSGLINNYNIMYFI